MVLHKLYGDYGKAIKLAKQLLKRYDYSINHIEVEKNLVPPFWIDMARLYEMYMAFSKKHIRELLSSKSKVITRRPLIS